MAELDPRTDPPRDEDKERWEREGCTCDRIGRYLNDECLYPDPCPVDIRPRSRVRIVRGYAFPAEDHG